MAVRIRGAATGDEPEVVEVVRAVYEEYGFTWEAEGYHADLYDLDGHYISKGHAFFVAEVSGDDNSELRIVGSAALRIFSALEGERGEATTLNGKTRIGGCDCSLDRLYVLPSARKAGIGTALAQAVIEEARSQGRTLMEIWSDKRFVDAHRLYGRLGARTVTDRILDDPDNSPEWGLVLEI